MRRDSRISRGIDLWINHELVLASQTVNELYSDYNRAVNGFSFPSTDPQNIAATKAISHTSRFMNNGAWFIPFESDPTNEDTTSKMMFACFMRASGARKNVAYTHALGQENFTDYLTNPANFSGARILIASALAKHPDSIGIEIIRDTNDKTIGIVDETICKIASSGGKFSVESRRLARSFEQNTLAVLTDYAIFAAQFRDGDVSKVPALEPKSISLDPAIIYPFSDEILDAGYPSVA